MVEDIRYLRYLQREDMINKSLMNETDYQKTKKPLFNNDTEDVMVGVRFEYANGGAKKDYTKNHGLKFTGSNRNI